MARTFTGESSATSLTSTYYMQNFYLFNRNAIKSSYRKDYQVSELSYEDSRALKRAASKLSSFEYSGDENADNIVNSIKAFAETYNNALDSTSSKDSDNYRQNRQLKALSQKYSDDLEDLGITFDNDGKMSVSENILKASSCDKVKEIFSKESDYIKGIRKISQRMNAQSFEDIYTMMTGNGGRLNIIL